ncbi:Kinetochore protein SPC25 [Heracleum sosnowskyi]|uniref:Kinetochore protein SPC25 n=1 Tax=Heracleum sosnowskyi TaxID=360622 RepID=A0AAD8H4S6_9APIA|nr:Kinetochore protein SPC25 [Heracleum sosnowskyi]
MKMGDKSVRSVMGELRLKCEQDIKSHQQKSITFLDSFRKSLESQSSIAQTTHQNQGKIGELKAQLRAAEDHFVKALALKTRKEAKRMAVMDSIAATKARVDKLKRVVEEQKARKDEYAEIISQQSKVLSACEEKGKKDSECREEVEEAISWYNRVLGFRIECGHGIKFIFNNINPNDPKEEYHFTIRHENDVYSLLDCDPYLNDTKELITELNKSNGLFQFVRTMREKFEATTCGTNPNFVTLEQDTSTVSASAPVYSISTSSRSQSPVKQKALQAGDSDRLPKKVNRGKDRLSAIKSPEYSSVRRSPRHKARK